MNLLWPSMACLPSYRAALEQGWSPNTVRPEAAQEDLARLDADPEAFVASLVDREAKGAPIKLPDGTLAKRLPGYVRWMWDGAFCGFISYRWQPDTCELPPHVLGHIGYSVVPWKQGKGYATRALALLLAEIQDMPYVELTTNLDNVPSQKVILANGGYLVERFQKPAAYGDSEGLRYRIDLPRPQAV